jgi:hypothetical protein
MDLRVESLKLGDDACRYGFSGTREFVQSGTNLLFHILSQCLDLLQYLVHVVARLGSLLVHLLLRYLVSLHLFLEECLRSTEFVKLISDEILHPICE